ncbi:MAG: hypothetical protein HYZ54_05705 [Ignavibacteriae bacterium]|nr:hypothetical protein [Ignavibacteriota bacterium]
MKLLFFILLLLTISGVEISAQNKALYMKNSAIFYAPVPTYSTQNITMEFWIKPERDDEHSYPLFLGSNFYGYGIHLHNGINGGGGNYASIRIPSASHSAAGNPVRLKLNTWTHIAITHDSVGWRFYRNGEYVGNGDCPANIDSTSKLQILYYTGTIDEIRMWGVTRSQKEIKESFQKDLTGNEKGLIEYYNMDSFALKFGEVIPNIAPDTSKNAVIYGDIQNIANVEGAPLVDAEYPDISFLEKPAHFQFFPRNDSTNSAPIHIAGKINSNGWDSVIILTFKNDTLAEYTSYPLNYTDDTARFEFNTNITASPILFTYRIYVSKEDKRLLIGESADLSCGDVYMISGQSNAHTASDSSLYVNPLLKSWGVLYLAGNLLPYNIIDSSWGMANGHGFNYFYSAGSGPYMTCEWGIEIQRLILEKYGIPTCIINAGAGSSSVYTNQRDDSSHKNLNTIYGRGLYRAWRGNVDKAVKAMFWFQGEGENVGGYGEAFNELYHDWKEDYPNLKVIYVDQLRPGCPFGSHWELRELQRNFSKLYPDIKIIATNAIKEHDGCHYYHKGYLDLAEKSFWQMEVDFYNSKDSANTTPPNVERAFYSTKNHDEIKIIYIQKKDELRYPSKMNYLGRVCTLEDYFYLDGIFGNVIYGNFNRDTLTLTLRYPSQAHYISYLPDAYYNGGDSVIYEGPWITNKKGIGALCFTNVPITSYTSTGVDQDSKSNIAQYYTSENTLIITNTSNSPADFSITYFNLIGQVIYEQTLSSLGSGAHSIPLPQMDADQVVFVRIKGNGSIRVLSVIQ